MQLHWIYRTGAHLSWYLAKIVISRGGKFRRKKKEEVVRDDNSLN